MKLARSDFEQAFLSEQDKARSVPHEDIYGAQAACKNLIRHWLYEALLEDSSKLSYLAISRVDERKGSGKYFSLHWKESFKYTKLQIEVVASSQAFRE